MSANISSMFFTGEVPWHGLGNPLVDFPTWDEAIVAAGLDWQVRLDPIATVPSDTFVNLASSQAIPTHRAVIRCDTQDVLGVVTARYSPIQNKDSFLFFDPFIKDGIGAFETAGALGKGERIWMLARIDKLAISLPDSEYAAYLLWSAAHDGSGAALGKVVHTRVVCQNTLGIALNERGFRVSVAHRGDVKANLETASRVFALAMSTTARFQKYATHLSAVPFESRVFDFTKRLLPTPVKPLDTDAETIKRFEAASDRIDTERENVVYLFANGRGNQDAAVAGTAWAALNAATEYADHYKASSGRVSNRMSYSLLGGAGDRFKYRASAIIGDMTNFALAA